MKKNITARNYFYAGAVILLLLVLLTAGFRVFRITLMRCADGFFYPYLSVASPSEKLSDSALLLCDKTALAVRVEQLSVRNRDLTLQSSAAADLLEENRMLRRMLNLPMVQEKKLVTGEIILRDPLRFKESFTVNKGSRDGISPGDAVIDITPDGRMLLVGRVSACGARSSKVVTISEQSVRISGRVGSNSAIGFTNTGNAHAGNNKIRFGWLPLRDDYVSGGVVTTTGFEKGIPANIKIGELVLTGNSGFNFSNSQDLSAALIPAVDFSKLRFVGIITQLLAVKK